MDLHEGTTRGLDDKSVNDGMLSPLPGAKETQRIKVSLKLELYLPFLATYRNVDLLTSFHGRNVPFIETTSMQHLSSPLDYQTCRNKTVI